MASPERLPGYGINYDNYPFKDTLDWFVHVRSPADAFAAQPSYLLSEYTFYVIGLLTLVHSFIVGGRWKYLWLGCVFHGITTELVCFALPDIDNYWHSQTTVMLVGRRLPLHIPLIYPSFMYPAAYAVAHLRLPRWAEPMAAGLVEVLVDLPYDIVAVKFLHWTWHDTDPSIYDRHYSVPWNSYYFHLTFGTAFTFAIHFWRRKITGNDDKSRSSGFIKETLCALLAGLCGMPGGVLQFIFLYHPLHDNYLIHTENCFFFIVVLYILIVWTADRSPVLASRRQKGESSHWSVYLLVVGLVLHYSLYLGLTIAASPENEVSIGLHETVGACDKTSDVNTAFGAVLKKRTYLCASDYDEPYFDFHCAPGGSPPPASSSWYTICGTHFANRAEYISMLTGICVAAIFVFYNMLFNSAGTLISKKQLKYTNDKKKRS
ncbi:hypothetical protein HAZT_HAZT005809 [Hyalella azteca]|uniref:Uncharacterized protein LOC108681950 n=1 Tax=Hyalella azteca TaxID=294128 RepID=A0A6A0H2W9_HYAAZ|nr:uncharacterized protein LOC108681950 [Hyalella azteca]KAA0195650.1 hypothetical protein HAZT_HAZT005809 [Hyalella azteca]